MNELSASDWDEFLSVHPTAHLLQTSAWGSLKSAFGWDVVRLAADNCGAQLLIRQYLPGIRLAYLPKGPVGDGWEDLYDQVDTLCRQRRVAFLKVEPDLWEHQIIKGDQPASPPAGFISSSHSIQPPRTLIVDLYGDEKATLAGMKQKTRYNINLALKKGVVIRPSSDISQFYNLMALTGQRDRFGVHSLEYYQRAYDIFHPLGAGEIFLAEFEDEPLAAVMVFCHGLRAWYLYGASSNQHRDRMPNYLLQWEAMRWAHTQGCREYDLWGVPDSDLGTLEANFSNRDDGLWGVYRFKRGFGGQLRRAVGPWDRIYNPFLYRIYHLWLKIRKIEG